MKRRTLFSILVFVLAFASAAVFLTLHRRSSNVDAPRAWTDEQGRELIVGSLNVPRTAGLDANRLPEYVYVLEGKESKSKPIPYKKLSVADRAYVDAAVDEYFSARGGGLSKIEPKDRFAFIVGSSLEGPSDQDASESQRPDCVLHDALLLKDRLIAGGYPEKNVVVLTKDSKESLLPSKENIEREFESFLNRLDRSSLAFVYFAGHGVELKGKTYFVPSGAAPKGVDKDRLVSIDDVMRKLARHKAGFRWMVVDACRNSPTPGVDAQSADFTIAKAPNSIMLLQSCRSGERSFEGGVGAAAQITNGFFTLALCEALDVNSMADRNADGRLLFSELLNYVSTRTSALAEQYYAKEQTPVVSGAVSDFTIATDLLVDDVDPRIWRKARRTLDGAKWLRRKSDYRNALLMVQSASALIAHAKSTSPRLKEFEDERLAIEALYRATIGALPQDWLSARPGDRRTLMIGGVEFAFRYCPPGTYLQGSPATEPRKDDEAQFMSTIEKGFWIQETETTQLQWLAIQPYNPSKFHGRQRPVESIAWSQAHDLIRKLNSLNLAPEGFLFRLPNEGQWEYAARAGGVSAYFWGDSLNGTEANCDGTQPCGTDAPGPAFGQTKDVKSYQPNAWGIYDMHGNVAEWCGGSYTPYPDEPYASDIGYHGGEKNDVKVGRGGSWKSPAIDCRSAARATPDPKSKFSTMGVRLALWPKDSVGDSVEKAEENKVATNE